MQDWLPKSCAHSGSFIQVRRLPSLPSALVSRGAYLYSCTFGLLWATTDPIDEQQLFKSNGKSLRLGQNQSIQPLDGPANRTVAKLLASIMGGKSTVVQRQFEINTDGETLRFSPKRKRLKKFVNSMSILKTNGEPTARLEFANGESLEMRFENTLELESVEETTCQEQGFAKTLCGYVFNDQL